MFRRQGQQPKPPVNRTLAEQRAHLAREVVETLLFVALVFLIVHVTVGAFRVQGTNGSSPMSPELSIGQSVLVNKAAYLFGGPSRGDVVVYVNPSTGDTSTPFIGRIVGVPGDTVTITATSVQLDGVTLREPYVHVTAGQTENSGANSTKLGNDQYFILNDNRVGTDSSDSRSFGPVPRQNIVGKAVLVFWPLSQRQWISNYSSVFEGIHQ